MFFNDIKHFCGIHSANAIKLIKNEFRQNEKSHNIRV